MRELKVFSDGSNMAAFEIKGTSMMPFLLNGDCVTIRKCAPAETNPGDIIAIALNKSGRTCIHRLVRKNTRGEYTDLFIKGDDIPRIEKIRLGVNGKFIGKVAGIIRKDNQLKAGKPWLNTARLFYSLFMMPYQAIRGH